MKHMPAYLLIGITALAGCRTQPQEFSVSGAPVYAADNPDELFMGEETITIKFGDNSRIRSIGRLKDGKLTFALPVDLSTEEFFDPNLLTIYNTTPGLKITSGEGHPDLYLYEPSSTQMYTFVYANKNGSFVSEGIKYNVKNGWNLVTNNGDVIDLITAQHSLQYRWVCSTNISAREYINEHKDWWADGQEDYLGVGE
jgi:hypothetical protein